MSGSRLSSLPYTKMGSVEEVTNYRPISILPTLSKILESAIKEQVVTYLSDNKLICDEQSAYPNGHSVSQLKRCSKFYSHPFYRLIPGSTQIVLR